MKCRDAYLNLRAWGNHVGFRRIAVESFWQAVKKSLQQP